MRVMGACLPVHVLCTSENAKECAGMSFVVHEARPFSNGLKVRSLRHRPGGGRGLTRGFVGGFSGFCARFHAAKISSDSVSFSFHKARPVAREYLATYEGYVRKMVEGTPWRTLHFGTHPSEALVVRFPGSLQGRAILGLQPTHATQHEDT